MSVLVIQLTFVPNDKYIVTILVMVCSAFSENNCHTNNRCAFQFLAMHVSRTVDNRILKPCRLMAPGACKILRGCNVLQILI